MTSAAEPSGEEEEDEETEEEDEELAAAEEKVSTLVRIDDEGRPILAPIAALKAGEAAKTPRAAGRKQRSRALPGMDDAGDDG